MKIKQDLISKNRDLMNEDSREVVVKMENIQKTYLIGIEGVTAVRGKIEAKFRGLLCDQKRRVCLYSGYFWRRKIILVEYYGDNRYSKSRKPQIIRQLHENEHKRFRIRQNQIRKDRLRVPILQPNRIHDSPRERRITNAPQRRAAKTDNPEESKSPSGASGTPRAIRPLPKYALRRRATKSHNR